MINDKNQFAKVLAVEMTVRTAELWRVVIHEERDPDIESASAYLHLHEHWRDKRLMIGASVPRGMREKRNSESITCNPDRKPETIAADICNRLLTHARAHLLESREYDQERRKEEAEKKLRLHFLRKYLPREYQSEKLCNSTSMRPANIYAHLTYDNLINLEITLPLKNALEILELLQKQVK